MKCGGAKIEQDVEVLNKPILSRQLSTVCLTWCIKAPRLFN